MRVSGIGFWRQIPRVVLVALFGVFTTAVAWLFVLQMTSSDLEVETRRINSENSALARGFEEHVARAVTTSDNALLFLKREYEDHGTTTQSMINFVEQARQDQILNQIGLANSKGDLLLSAVPRKKPINIAHREHFRVHAASSAGGLFVAKPVVNQAAGAWSIFLSRRLNGPDGSFGGVVTAGIDPLFFSNYFDAPELGPGRTIVLVGRDGIVRARRFQQQSEVGQDISASPLFKYVRSAAVGNYEVVSPVDGQPKLASYRVVRGTSLVVVVSELKETALAGFQQRKKANFQVAVFFTCFTAVFCVLLIRSVRLSDRQNARLEAELAERAAAEAVLRKREKQLAESQQIAHIGSWEHNLTTGEVVWSDELFRLLGFDPRQDPADFKMFFGMIHPDDQPTLKHAIDETVKTGRHFSIDYRFILRDGTTRILHAQAELKHGETGAQTILSGTTQDLTERKQTEDTIRESERKFRTLFNSVNDSILIHDLEGNFLEVNDYFCRLLGYSREEFLRMSPADIDTPEAARNVPANIRNVIQKGESQFESEQLTSDGRMIPVEISAKVIDFEGQKAVISVCRDITERRRAEDRLRQSEHFVRNILDNVDEGFLVIDRDYRIVTANAAYCGQVALPCEEVIGKHCYEVSHRTHQPCFLDGEDCAVRQVFATGAPRTATHQHLDAHDGIIYVETKCFPIKDHTGAVTSVIETINNITERHLLEEERLKTQKLESIGTLAGGIAHDFNNLLQGVFGYISMAKLTFDQREKSQAMLEQAEKALHQSVNLTNQLLTFSKGGRPVKTRTILFPVIENAVKFALSGSRSEYRIACDPGLWHVDADEGQLGQVIQNIVLNADQAMPLGGSVVISARNLPACEEARPLVLGKRDHVVISIRDTGAGMPQQYLGRIFDPYFTTKEKGSGLGLATSYSIIRNHEGLIEVQSELGTGSTFLVYLPAAAAITEQLRPEAVPAETRVGRILVMDDEEFIRNVAGELLAALGHTAAFADKGETALAAFRGARESGRPFDVVILDLTIRGGMGGEETLRRLLEIDPDVNAVVSSGYSDNATLANYLQRGFKAFLKKPYNMRELQSTLQALLA